MVQGRRAAWGLAAVLGVPLAIAVAGSTSHAQDLMSLGTGAEIENVARIGNKQLPLPEGKWELVLSEADRRGSVQSGTAFLVRKANERIVGYLFVRTNLEIGGGIGWKRPRWCQRNNVHHNGSDKYYNKEDADCWIVNHRTYTNKVLRVEFYNRMKTYLRDHGATSTVVGHRYWRNDSTDYMLVSLFIDPVAFGFPPERGKRWVESQWHVNAVGDGTPRRGFVDAMKAFGNKYREAVRRGFRSRLDAGAPDLKFAFER